jgi:hypothetical protein
MFAVTLDYKASDGSRQSRELVGKHIPKRRINSANKSVEYRYKPKETISQRTHLINVAQGATRMQLRSLIRSRFAKLVQQEK